MLNNTPDPVLRKWSPSKVAIVGIVVGSLCTAGVLSLRACRPPANERPQTSPAQAAH